MVKLKYKKLTRTAKAPCKSCQNNVGYNFFADETKTIPPFFRFNEKSYHNLEYNNKIDYIEYIYNLDNRLLIKTGITIQISQDQYLMFKNSNNFMVDTGLMILTGIIDYGDLNELVIVALNTSHEDIAIKIGDKISQAFLLPVLKYEFQEINNSKNKVL